MVLRMVTTLLLVASPLAVAATVAGNEADSFLWRPVAAIVLPPTMADDDALLAWTPGPLPADEYDVYGITGAGTLVPLLTVQGDQSSATVPPDYPLYGVTAIRQGIPAAMRIALSPDCVRVEPGPPPDAGWEPCAAAIT